jgi:Holliday junction resolvasome RuvABC DNA-binding subunit
MRNQDEVLSLLVSLYKELIDLKAKAAATKQNTESTRPEHVLFSQNYRATVRQEVEQAAHTLKALGFSPDKVDIQLTHAFADITQLTTKSE